MKQLFTLFFIALVQIASATHLKPWLGQDLLPQLSASYTLQRYHWVRISNHSTRYSSTDHFVAGGAYVPYAPYSLEVEVDTAGTTRTNYGWNDVIVTGRYQLMDDISGEDVVSAVAGISIAKAAPKFVRDISTFHHGTWEYMFHGSIGKEEPCGPTWGRRAWGLVGLGIANKGSFWVFSHLEYERNACDRYWYGIFLNGLFGMGNHDLVLDEFIGYGPIKHRSVDLGAKFTYSFWENGTLMLRYSFRVWAENFPAYTNLATIEFQYPFGL